MIPQRIPNPRTELDDSALFCAMTDQWGIAIPVLERLMRAQAELPFDLWIFSGIRDADEQAEVSATPSSLSTHADRDTNGCPRLATGADVQPLSPGVRIDDVAVAQMGAAFTRAGLRWGGGAPFNDRGIPVGNERWHVDLGPRPN